MDLKNENAGPPETEDGPSVEKIQQLLRTKDDTSRFVGLALLKSVLDSSVGLREDGEVVAALWDSISPKFLDRLLRTGSQPVARGDKNSHDMLDLVVAVLHTFTVLLPEDARRDAKLLGRIPRLVKAALYSSKETTTIIVQTLATLAVVPEGAKIIADLDVEEWSPLIEVAPEQPHVLTVFLWAWELGTVGVEDETAAKEKINRGIQSFISSFRGTDAASLLEFVSHILRGIQANLIPENPAWLPSLTKLVRNLSTGRPAAAARSAYTNCAGALLLVYPESAPRLLFSDEPGSSKPFAYLFISLILVDIRATLPSLLAKLNDPDYPQISQRLTSAFDTLAAFIGQLIAWLESMDDESSAGMTTSAESPSSSLNMPPDLVLKLSKSIAEALSVAMEFLRDRWDAAVAGAQGLHPSARSGATHTPEGSRMTLAWDAKGPGDHKGSSTFNAASDPLTLSSIRAIALWLKDDDGDALREEGSGLMDMFLELYQTTTSSSSSETSPPNSGGDLLDFRLPVLAALEGTLRTPNGIEAFLAHDGWTILSKDLLSILSATSSPSPNLTDPDLIRGSRIILALTILVQGGDGEDAPQGIQSETWMDVVTAVAAYDVPDYQKLEKKTTQAFDDILLEEFQIDVLRLAALLIRAAPDGVRRRYAHSAGAVRGVVEQLRGKLGSSKQHTPASSRMVGATEEELAEVMGLLSI